ncbi:MAG: hypothetical protein NTV57_04585 [Cyanobacteria bacterium]|nr:hypothetical protein [Cyanobacteriota bacterium]
MSASAVAATATSPSGPDSTDDLIASLGEGEEAIDRLLEAVVAIKRQQRSLEEQLNALLDQLQQLHECGEVDATFHFSDTAFSWSPGRLLFSYPEPVLALEQQLKLARKAAEGDGTATRRHGRSFWTIKLPGT